TACGHAIDADVRFVSLCQALTHLCVIDRYAAYREMRRELLGELILRCFNRACFAIADIIAVPEEEFGPVIQSLLGVAELVLRGAEWESFLVMLARLRSALERLSAPQRDSLAMTVAERYGLKESRDVTELRTSAAAAARIADIDRRVAAILRDWEFT